MLIKKISFISIVIFISCSSNEELNKRLPISNFNGVKIGFASCLNQEKKMPIFNAIKAEGFDLFLMMGDNVYGNSNSENLNELREAYNKQRQNFDKLDFDFPIEAIWDDNDYGLGDGGKEYHLKEKSKELFLDFWNISTNDPRRQRKGLYHEVIQNYNGKSIQFLFLDTRTFRDNLKPSDDRGAIGKERYVPFPDTSLTMLGRVQWQWLAQKISKPVNFRVIVSSIQFLAIGHGWECWNNLPYERKKLIDLIDKSNINHTVILSGDRHRGGMYQLKTNSNKIISEMTSSSLNVPYSNPEELGPLRIGSTYSKENYGVIQLSESQDSLSVMLKNIKGEVVNSFKSL